MAISNLNSFFKNNLNKSDANAEIGFEIKNEKPKSLNYEDWGFKKAGHLNGAHTSLLQCLARIREDHKRMVKEDKARQDKLKEPFIASLESNQEELEHKEEDIKTLNENIPAVKEKIDVLEREIITIKKNPGEIMPDKMSKASFIIGLLILAALTIYLFIFYSSASFSAFFKTFTLNEIGVASSIFDPQAIPQAFNDSVTELILIISMPFVFIGLGFLIHKFQEQKGIGKYFKIAMLIVITFIFDAILAYEITEKIYNIKAENSFDDIPAYDIAMAFNQVNFWLIIFAGFVVYIIWGFVFDFTMEAYDKLNVIKQAIIARRSEIDLHKGELSKKELKLQEVTRQRNAISILCNKLKTKINGVIVDTAEFDKILHEFLGGWTHWMSANLIPQDQIDIANQKADEFIKVNVRSLQNNPDEK